MRKIHGFLWTWYGLWFFQHATNYRSKAALYLRRLHLLFRVQLHTKHDQYTCWYIKTKKKKKYIHRLLWRRQVLFTTANIPANRTTHTNDNSKWFGKKKVQHLGSGKRGEWSWILLFHWDWYWIPQSCHVAHVCRD